MNDTVGLSIIGTECKSACAGEPDLEKRIRKAMAVVANSHWMFCDPGQEDLRFRGALAGVILSPETTEEEKECITRSLKPLRALNALMSGVPVDMGAVLEEQGDKQILPLMKWWHEAKAGGDDAE
jgi:hypothetical protein